MTKTHQQTPPAKRWAAAIAIVSAALLLGSSTGEATNYEAIAKRLRVAVAKGHITDHQAEVMMDALRHTDEQEERERHEHEEREHEEREHEHAEHEREHGEREHQLEERERKFHRIAAEIKEAVENGKLSEEQAERKLDHVRAELFAKHDGEETDVGDEIRKEISEVAKHLEIAVEKSEITHDAAWERWHHFKEELEPRLKEAVEHEHLSREEARDIMHSIKRAEVGKRLKHAVESGELTEEQAREKWKAFERESGGH